MVGVELCSRYDAFPLHYGFHSGQFSKQPAFATKYARSQEPRGARFFEGFRSCRQAGQDFADSLLCARLLLS
jgi:hypothetical protein